MQIKTTTKKFYDLTHDELFDVFFWRQEVFTVEQKCTDNDMDEYDKVALHVLVYSTDKLAAYCRIIPAGYKYKEWSIGRIITPKDFRGKGMGHALMQNAIDEVKRVGGQAIRISAQAHLEKFYNTYGFIKTGEEYIEADIPQA